MITNAITYSLIVGIAKERYKLQHFMCTLDIFCFQISQMKAKHLVNWNIITLTFGSDYIGMRNVVVHLYINCLKQTITQPEYALYVDSSAEFV